MPAEVARLSIDDIADQIVTEALHGTDGTDAKIGLIGEIGVSSDLPQAKKNPFAGPRGRRCAPACR